MKICIRCKVNKQLEFFTKKKKNKDGLDSYCKECVRYFWTSYKLKNKQKILDRDKVVYRTNPQKHKDKSRASRFKQKYWPHLSIKEALAEWNRLYEKQDGLCAVCERKKPLEVDHCHKTGKIRELICGGCNTALARSEEDLGILINLYKYVMEHNDVI